jgi:hypothetical protein
MQTPNKLNDGIRKPRRVKNHKIGGDALLLSNARCARKTWGSLSKQSRTSLSDLTKTYGLSVPAGHLHFFDGRWYVTHAGLLSVAYRNRCAGMKTAVDKQLSDAGLNRWVFKATVYKRPGSNGFVGYGDAEPSNVSPLVRGAEMRVAETRAVNRALRKAYGIGLCSVEELGWAPRSDSHPREVAATHDGNGNGTHSNHHQPRLRDRLCLLIRQHRLDPNLVKSYAAEFCGTSTLREASRERLEEFVNHLSQQAATDRDALVCQLNNFNKPSEVRS